MMRDHARQTRQVSGVLNERFPTEIGHQLVTQLESLLDTELGHLGRLQWLDRSRNLIRNKRTFIKLAL